MFIWILTCTQVSWWRTCEPIERHVAYSNNIFECWFRRYRSEHILRAWYRCDHRNHGKFHRCTTIDTTPNRDAWSVSFSVFYSHSHINTEHTRNTHTFVSCPLRFADCEHFSTHRPHVSVIRTMHIAFIMLKNGVPSWVGICSVRYRISNRLRVKSTMVGQIAGQIVTQLADTAAINYMNG